MPYKAIFKTSNTDVLARWYNELNGWAWPDDLPGKPADATLEQGRLL